jgi:hypothetical protein
MDLVFLWGFWKFLGYLPFLALDKDFRCGIMLFRLGASASLSFSVPAGGCFGGVGFFGLVLILRNLFSAILIFQEIYLCNRRCG